MKLCRKCHIEKPLASFGKHSRNADGLQYQCKDCVNLAARICGLKPETKALRKKAQNTYRSSLQGMSTRKSYDETYRNSLKRKEYKRKYDDKYFSNRKQTDEVFHLSCKIRKLLNIGVKKQGFSKKSKTANILGCDFEFFHLYLEMQFTSGMSWDNFGEWHLDHIYPISHAKDIEEFKLLNRYTNFQPMWGKYNIIKSDMLPAEWKAYVTKHGIDVHAKPNN